MRDLSEKTVLVTGGAGSLGVHLVRQLLEIDVKTVRVLDSNEYGLFLLNREVSDPRLRCLLGDVKDRERTLLALKDIDFVIHAAALKNIEVTEYNAPEAIRTNVDGTINLVETAMLSSVKKFLFVSSDKAVNSPTLYGATKYVGERLVKWANQVSNQMFSAVRMGNFLEARGNVFDVWKQQSGSGKPLTLTHRDMSRYFFETSDAAKFVLRSLEIMTGGEIFIPKMQELSIFDLMKKLYPDSKWKEVGLREGERMHEQLMTEEERKRATDHPDGFWVFRA